MTPPLRQGWIRVVLEDEEGTVMPLDLFMQPDELILPCAELPLLLQGCIGALKEPPFEMA